MLRYRGWVALFVLAALAYVAVSFAVFQMPDTLADAENCGFLPDEFVAAGQLTYERTSAWWVSFQRMGEVWSALSVALAVTFMRFALSVRRRAGGGVSVGATLGGGVLALSALCVSCLAPVLPVVGLGLAGSLLAGLPKWLIALNTLLLTGWGVLYLTRRAGACRLPRAATGQRPDAPGVGAPRAEAG